ncbi:DUF6442 family protein [Jeotgalibaca dankookensis]|uniref:DUF6442 family protein n=1 Tax=Jeotgalibaca dankookensis TaxID=708126 RepID=UPI0007807ED0|nr:DUF6442 family protein [Jeotgalibaca dankookensis]
MKKEDILNRYRQEEDDEGQTRMNTISDDQGFYAINFLAFILMGYQIFKDLPFGAVPALLFVFLSTGAFSRYKMTQEKLFLWMGLLTGLLCLGSLSWYVIQTW